MGPTERPFVFFHHIFFTKNIVGSWQMAIFTPPILTSTNFVLCIWLGRKSFSICRSFNWEMLSRFFFPYHIVWFILCSTFWVRENRISRGHLKRIKRLGFSGILNLLHSRFHASHFLHQKPCWILAKSNSYFANSDLEKKPAEYFPLNMAWPEKFYYL